jgi:outer membrane protein insertion porin family
VFPIIRGRAAATAALLLALCGLYAAPLRAQDPVPPPAAEPGEQPVTAGFYVDEVLVRGNVRVAEAGVTGTAGLAPGATVGPADVAEAIRRLMATGQFAAAEVYVRGAAEGRGTLVIAVEERPIVTQIAFEGLETIRGSTVRDSAGLREGAPLQPQRVAFAERLIRDLLAARGVQALSVESAVTPLDDGHRLTFHVREGPRLAIADVQFVGNEAFGDDALRGAMRTRPEGFWWFRSGRFDRDAFREDLSRNLPEFYGSRGYIDFAVISDTLVVDPESGKARLVVQVHEGPQYRLGEVEVLGNQRFPSEQLVSVFTTQRRSVLGLPFGRQTEREAGEVFDQPALDRATDEIRQMYSNEGYLFAQVIPTVERVPGERPVVNVALNVSEQQPFYIRSVSFRGNTHTHESVIRERIWILPGDVYNEARVIQSYQSIAGLGFFEVPMPTPDISPDPETGMVDITFIVTEKQTGNINFGTVFGGNYGGRRGGLAGFLGYQQPNLFGQAKQANFRAEYGYGRSTLEASYTDPSLLGSRNSGSLSVFRMGDRYFRVGGGRRLRTGASTQFGFPVPGSLRTRAFLGYSLSRTDFEADEDVCEPGSVNVFCLPNATASSLSGSLSRDTKNHPMFPTAGTRHSVTLEQTGGPLGGDGNFQKLGLAGEWWVPVARLGAGPRPIQMAVGVQARGGAIFGDVGAFPFERYYVGGTQFGQPLRGYTEASIGPRGYRPECGRRDFQLDCLGDAFVTLTGEYAIRLTDAVSVSAFADAGNVFASVGEFNTTRMFRSLGIGGTLVTPFLGAIGVDAAYGFDRTDPGWEIHFKLGNVF